MARTLYQVLGVEREASSREIEAAFRERVEELRSRGDTDPESMATLHEAYQVLVHVERRAEYDDSLPALPASRRARPDDAAALNPWLKWGMPALVVVVLGAWWSLRPAETPPRGSASKVVSTEVLAPSSNTSPSSAVVPSALPEGAVAPTSATPRRAGSGSAEDVFAEVSGSVARIRVTDTLGQPVSQGSGVVVDSSYVITNCHVTQAGDKISVKIGNEEYPAAVAMADEVLDLCRLAVSGLTAPAVSVGSVESVRTGQRVYAIGAPHGLELTISEGIVSSLREVKSGTVIQTTAPISPGSSGGGLFDASGKLVGIVTFQHRYGQNLNFAIPADWIAQMQSRSR